MIPLGGRFPRGNDPPGPNGQGRGSWFLAVVGSNPPSPLLPVSAKSWPRCCLADFGSRIKISADLLGQNYKFFEPHLFRLVRRCGGWAEMRPHWKLRGRGGLGAFSPLAISRGNPADKILDLTSCILPAGFARFYLQGSISLKLRRRGNLSFHKFAPGTSGQRGDD